VSRLQILWSRKRTQDITVLTPPQVCACFMKCHNLPLSSHRSHPCINVGQTSCSVFCSCLFVCLFVFCGGCNSIADYLLLFSFIYLFFSTHVPSIEVSVNVPVWFTVLFELLIVLHLYIEHDTLRWFLVIIKNRIPQN
jgi:hypothetical protein